MNEDQQANSMDLLRRQRSHLLFLLADAAPGLGPAFLRWYQGPYRQSIADHPSVLDVQHYECHEVDITQGRYAALPFRYLGLYELSLDGAEEAARLIEHIERLHQDQSAAQTPATWLYYPASEKVGRAPAAHPALLTLAFANGLAGQEAEFREWYATRHIRHALNVPVLVSGQCFERTLFQRPGALEAQYATIAVYEQEGPPEAILEAFAALPKETFHFPMLDKSRFAEWVYRPLSL